MPSSPVSAVPAASSATALAHFAARLSLETDCADVHAAIQAGTIDFVLVDARGPEVFARGHIHGAINLPHRDISAERLAAWPDGTLFAVYCAGPHCNGADHAALRLARLGRPVKLILGGMTGWRDEGFPVA